MSYVRRYPYATIYAADAVQGPRGKRTVDPATRTDPVFNGTLGGDSLFVGFPFTVEQAVGGVESLGKYIVFQEHPMAPRFAPNLDVGTPGTFGTPPGVWRELAWAETVHDSVEYDAQTYLDATRASVLWGTSLPDVVAGGTPQHRWGFSAAHMAHILLRPPVMIAIHASELLANGA